ncbi:MAG: signal peptidase I [Acidobacteria bacterium]|nr:signal peptidase I [Acidobacteriota bacterium]
MKKWIVIGLVIVVLIGLGVIATPLFLFRAMHVPTGAMANTIIPGDGFWAKRWVGEIKRGDIVIFEPPSNRKVLFVMRVIGMPGESIQFRGKKVLIDGEELPERRAIIELPTESDHGLLKESSHEGEGKYTALYTTESWNATDGAIYSGMKFGVAAPFQIPSGHYFVLGDSRDNSMDSRFWGPVPENQIKAKPYIIYSSKEPSHLFAKLEINP